jgi:hypothetical protein
MKYLWMGRKVEFKDETSNKWHKIELLKSENGENVSVIIQGDSLEARVTLPLDTFMHLVADLSDTLEAES